RSSHCDGVDLSAGTVQSARPALIAPPAAAAKVMTARDNNATEVIVNVVSRTARVQHRINKLDGRAVVVAAVIDRADGTRVLLDRAIAYRQHRVGVGDAAEEVRSIATNRAIANRYSRTAADAND